MINRADIFRKIAGTLGRWKDISFAYVHGPVLDSDAPHDSDVAVYLKEVAFSQLECGGSVSLDVAIPLELELEESLGHPVDLQVLNRAPLPFRARVVTQRRTVVDNDPAARADFEYRSRYEYIDFRPRREE